MKRNLLLSVVLATTCGCTQNISTPIVIDKDQTDRLVVNGYVATVNQKAPVAIVQVSKTRRLSQPGSPELMANAIVTMNGSPMPFDMFSALYVSPPGLTPADTYELKVNVGTSTARGEDKLPSFIPIAEARFTGETKSIIRYAGSTGEDFYELKISFDDPPGAGDCYQLLLSVLDSNGVASGFVFDNSMNYYDFACNDVSIYEEQFSEQDPFSSSSTVFIPSDMMIMHDKYFDGKKKEISMYINRYFFTDFSTGSSDPAVYENVYVGLHHMSKKSFDYYKNVKLQEMNDGNPFAEPTIIAGTVTGALGFFGCRAVATTRLKSPL